MATKNKAAKKTGNGTRRAWTKHDAKQLKAHSKAKTPVLKIAKEMGRTEGALRQHAIKMGIALGHRR